MSERIFGAFRNAIVLIGAHVALAIVLLGIAVSTDGAAITALWIATGLFGGSVYCFSRLNARHVALEQAEEWGHLAGVLLSLALVLLIGDWRSAVVAGAGLALGVAALISLREVVITGRAERRQQ